MDKFLPCIRPLLCLKNGSTHLVTRSKFLFSKDKYNVQPLMTRQEPTPSIASWISSSSREEQEEEK